MAHFLDNTIYTDYALHKICENLAENISNFNFIKVKVGSGDNTLYQNRTDLDTLLYSLTIQNTSYDQDKGILTIRCELPPELADVPITEIGLFDTVMGFDHLFSYSKVNIVKPSDIGYELTIVLNLGPRTIDFPGLTEFYIPKYEYATAKTLNDFTDTFIFVSTNLERAIRSNAGEIGKNMAEVAYKRQKEIREALRNTAYASFYYSLYNKFRNDLGDVFFIHEPDYLSYDICNYTDTSSYLESYHKIWKANKDNISWHKGPSTLLVMAKLADINTPSTLINKKNERDLYFSMDIQKRTEPFMCYIGANGLEYETAEYNELVITFYSLEDVYEIRYVFDMRNVGQYINQTMPYAITFNGDFGNPQVRFYFNNEEPVEFKKPTVAEPTIEEQAHILPTDSDWGKKQKLAAIEDALKSRLYGKVIINNPVSVLEDMPDNSYIPIKNYTKKYVTDEISNYENGIGVTNIITLKKQANRHELAFLCNSLITMGETED